MADLKPRRHDIEAAAEDALAAARAMRPGPARNDALKIAGRLRRQADEGRRPLLATAPSTIRQS